MSPPWIGWPLWNICVTNDHGYVPLVVNTSRSFSHSWLITGFVTRLTWPVPLVEQELPTHLSSPPVFSGVHVTQSLVLYVCFVDRCLSFCTLSFGHCVVCSCWYTDSEYLPLVSSNSSYSDLVINLKLVFLSKIMWSNSNTFHIWKLIKNVLVDYWSFILL
jgi:hypothetical protein